ncbi:hypothetical protein BCR34DRAFT_577708 [Clohesyomyces aquaticus]|uniref:Uncharacterized protein n=1 Tax=Clohesyomyces aquaticus TaxID=1231657 RepID=A0A1Y1YJ63_9PLEO|nr:hypothetical protein BCR34DRAFT_577708 [Clohesyomyces aquaticus]
MFRLPEDIQNLMTGRRVLNLLQFENMHERIDEVGIVHEGTFQWILDDSFSEGDTVSGAEMDPRQRVFSNSSADKTLLLDQLVKDDPDHFNPPVGRHLSVSPDKYMDPVAAKERHLTESGDGTVSALVPSTERYNNFFINWIRHGVGIFHFVGIPGSGKSTLMKFLNEHPKLMHLLQAWGGSRKLVSGRYFFWGTGEKKQRTITGFCRALLHDILAACPELIPEALPELWNQAKSTPWQIKFKQQLRSDHIIDALTTLLKDRRFIVTHCFAFFIDGLDEQKEERADHDDLSALLLDWANSNYTNIKICVSSRPNFHFLNAFDESQRLWLHKHTEYDQRRYVSDRLRLMYSERDDFAWPKSLYAVAHESSKQKLVERIVQRCRGDFRQLSLTTKMAKQAIDAQYNAYSTRHLGTDFRWDDIDHLIDTLDIGDPNVFSSVHTKDPADELVLRSRNLPLLSQLEEKTTNSGSPSVKSELQEIRKFLGGSGTPEEDLFAAKDTRMVGTCEWFTEKEVYRQWCDFGSNSPRILWVTGIPAAGKSTLAGHSVEHLQKIKANYSYFFFKYSDRSKSLLSACLRSLASQLAYQSAPVRVRLLDIIHESESSIIDINNERLLWHRLFVNGVFQATTDPQYWIIDGLDECENASTAFKTLLSHSEVQPLLRILVTSRETSALRSGFTDLGHASFHHEPIYVVDTLPDIKLYVEAKSRALISTDDASRANLVEKIVSNSKGSFLWTSLVLNELSHSYSEKDMIQVLEDIPRGMEPLYQRTLDMMSRSEGGKGLTKAILAWATCATRPLKLDELEGALKADIQDKLPNIEGVIRALCGQLVTIDKLRNVQMLHETAREFLLSESATSEFAVSKKEAHTRIGKACLEYLITEEMKPPRLVRRATTTPRKRLAFHAYAGINFSYHLAEADGSSQELLHLLTRFLGSNVLSWVETVAQTSDLRPLIQASKNLRKYAKTCTAQGEIQIVEKWSTDLIRLSARFSDALIQAPFAIFALIPPLCPTNSAIYQIAQQGRGLSIVGFANSDWGNRLSCIEFRSQTSSICHGHDFFAVGLTSGVVAIYHATTAQEYRVLNHGEPVNLINFLNCSGLFASCGPKFINVWDIARGESKYKLEAPRRCISLAYDRGFLFAACDKNYLASWDLNNNGTREADRPWDAGDEFADSQLRRAPSAISISPEHKMIAIASPGRPIIIWSLDHDAYYGSCGKKLPSGDPSLHPVTGLVFNPNPALGLLAASYLDGELVLLDPFNDETLMTTRANCPKLAASPDGRLLAGAPGAGTIDVYGFESLRLVYRVKSSNLYIRQVAFSRDNIYIVDIRGSQCNVWDHAALHRASIVWDTSETLASFVESATSSSKTKVSAILVDDQRKQILCGRDDGSVMLYDLGTGNEVTTLYRHKSRIHILTVRSHNVIMSVDESNSVMAWSLDGFSNSPLPEDKQLFQFRLESGNTVTQLLSRVSTGDFILSTRESDHFWTMDGPREVSRIDYEAPGRRKWTQHALVPDGVICIHGSTVLAYSWEGSRLPGDLELPSGPTDLQVKALIPCTLSRSLKLLVEFSELHGGTDTRNLNILDVKPLNVAGGSATENVPFEISAAQFPGCFIDRVFHIIDISDAHKLIFLDRQSWVCSVALDQKWTNTFLYTRHFFVPYDWFSGSRGTICALSKRDLIFAKDDCVVVVKGGLNFVDTVTLSISE